MVCLNKMKYSARRQHSLCLPGQLFSQEMEGTRETGDFQVLGKA